jgi:uncharacterized membrane protein YuzA (DUF378 family)
MENDCKYIISHKVIVFLFSIGLVATILGQNIVTYILYAILAGILAGNSLFILLQKDNTDDPR